MSMLFSPHALGELTLKNRIVIAPMCQYSASDGNPTDWHLVHWGQLLLSGAGMLILEATAVEPDGRISAGDLGLWSDTNEQALRQVLQSARRFSPMPVAIQLSHAGRKASSQAPWEGGQMIPLDQGGWPTFAPSALPHLAHETSPTVLSHLDLDRIRQAFVDAAQRACRAGVDVIELHAAHGYLLHQFLSPLSNIRTDAYGGSLSNRMRFPMEVFEAVRAALPSAIAVGVRLSGTDWVDGGWDIDQSEVFGQALRERGCSYLHVSSGGLSPLQRIPLGPGYQVGLAQRIKERVGLPTMAVGLITEAQQAEDIIARGQADFVAVARSMLYNPRWAWHAAAQLNAQVQVPPQYWRCQPRESPHLFGDIRFGQR